MRLTMYCVVAPDFITMRESYPVRNQPTPGIEGWGGGGGVMMYMYSGRWCPMHSSDVLPFVGVIVEWLQYNTMYV